MEMMYYQQLGRSYQDSLQVIEADIQLANSLAAQIPRAKGGARVEMKLAYNQWAPLFLLFLQWMDCSCTYLVQRYLNLCQVLIYKVYADGRRRGPKHGRKATISDFYSIILPSLKRIHGDLVAKDGPIKENHCIGSHTKKKIEGGGGSLSFADFDMDRDNECGICLEPCTKMVLPNCCHAMCINCYRDWNIRSASCPFCRGSLKRVMSRDLWVLTCDADVVDPETVSKEDLSRFYLYINSLPKDSPDALFIMYYEYLI